MKTMSRDRQRKVSLRLSLASAFVILVGAGLLIGDHVATTLRAPSEKSRVEGLVEQVKTEPEVAELLHDERERQTNVSLARKSRSRVVAWVLLAAGGFLVAGGKWYVRLRPQRLPRLDELVALRFPPPTHTNGKRPSAAPAAEDASDMSFVDELVARLGGGRESAIPILQAIQSHYRFLPAEALRRVVALTEITPAQIAGISTFYAKFRGSPVGRYVVRVCHGTACHVAGVEQIDQELRRHLEIPTDADTDPRGRFTLDAVACLGCCSLAPVMMIEEETAGRLTPATARQVLDNLESST
jgi:NADH:ubiquinone oxidoreductase subunit E